jgi:probable HAF family extracellular repeat protein
MQDLGDLPGGSDYSEARGINTAGQVVGYSDAATGGRAFLWDAVGGMQNLGRLPGGGSNFSFASAINDPGQLVGWSDSALGRRAFFWDAVGGMRQLDDLPNSYLSFASAINDAGQVVGGIGIFASGNHAVLWDTVDGMQDLNDLIDPGLGVFLASATAINASGQIVGIGTINGYEQAFLLTPTADVPVPAALPLMLGGLGVLAGVARRRSKRGAPAAN